MTNLLKDPYLEKLMEQNPDAKELRMAPPVIAQTAEGHRYALPQVYVQNAHESLLRQIAAFTAALVVQELKNEGYIQVITANLEGHPTDQEPEVKPHVDQFIPEPAD